MESYTAPDGTTRYRMTQDEYGAMRRQEMEEGYRRLLPSKNAGAVDPLPPGYDGPTTPVATNMAELAGQAITSTPGKIAAPLAGAVIGARFGGRAGAAAGFGGGMGFNEFAELAQQGRLDEEGATESILREGIKGGGLALAAASAARPAAWLGGRVLPSTPLGNVLGQIVAPAAVEGAAYEVGDAKLTGREISPLNIALDTAFAGAVEVPLAARAGALSNPTYSPDGVLPDTQAGNLAADSQARLDALLAAEQAATPPPLPQQLQLPAPQPQHALPAPEQQTQLALPAPEVQTQAALPAPSPHLAQPLWGKQKPPVVQPEPATIPSGLAVNLPAHPVRAELPAPGQATAQPVAGDVGQFTTGENPGVFRTGDSSQSSAARRFGYSNTRRRFNTEEAATKHRDAAAEDAGVEPSEWPVTELIDGPRPKSLKKTAQSNREAAATRAFDAESQREVPRAEVVETAPKKEPEIAPEQTNTTTEIPTQPQVPKAAQKPVEAAQRDLADTAPEPLRKGDIEPSEELLKLRKRLRAHQRNADRYEDAGERIPKGIGLALGSLRRQTKKAFDAEHPGLGNRDYARFLETGRVRAGGEGVYGNALGAEAGAAIRPIKAISEGLGRHKANKEFLARERDLHKRISKAEGTEREKLIHELRGEVKRFAEDSPLSKAELDAKVAESKKKEHKPLFIDTSATEGLSHKDVVSRAKSLGVRANGRTTDIRERIAIEETRRTKLNSKSTPEEFEANVASVSASLAATKKKRATKGSFEADKRALYHTFVDSRKNIHDFLRDKGDAGKAIRDEIELAAHSDSIAEVDVRDFEESVYAGIDARTKKSEREWYGSNLFGDTRYTEKELLDHVIQMRSSLELAEANPNLKFTDGGNAKQFRDQLDAVQSTPEGQRLYDQSERYFERMRELPEELFDEGIISKEQLEKLQERQYYMRRHIIRENPDAGVFDHLFEPARADGGKLSGGSLKPIEGDASYLAEQVLREQRRRIQRNRAGVELHNAIKDSKELQEAGFRMLTPKPDTNGVPSYPKPDDTEGVITAFIDGKEHRMAVPKWFEDSWKPIGAWGSDQPAAVRALVKGALEYPAAILHSTTTGALNPTFFVRNVPRDMDHLWATTDAYSAFKPKALAQMSTDLWAVRKDAWRGFRNKRMKGALRDYYLEGGGGATFSELALDTLGAQGKARRGLETLATLNQYSEDIMRLAHRNRLIKQGMSPSEATAAARDRINFHAGGAASKRFARMVPYFNAAIQGKRSVFRAVKDRPKRSAAVFGQQVLWSATKAAAIYAGGKYGLDRIYDRVSDEEKLHNDIIPTPFYTKDENGEKEFFYVKIAKDDSTKLGTYIGDQLGRVAAGKTPNWDLLPGIATEQVFFSSFSSTAPTSLNALAAYGFNFDTFRNKNVWNGDDVGDDKHLETDQSVNPAFNALGEATGISPKRGQRAAGKIINENNLFIELFGSTVRIIDAMAGGDERKKDRLNAELVELLIEGGSGGLVSLNTSDAVANKMARETKVAESVTGIKLRNQIDEVLTGIESPEDVVERRGQIQEFLRGLPPERQQEASRKLLNSLKSGTQSRQVRAKVSQVFWGKSGVHQSVEYFDSWVRAGEEERKALEVAASIAPRSDKWEYYLSKLAEKHKEQFDAARDGKQAKGIDRLTESRWLRSLGEVD